MACAAGLRIPYLNISICDPESSAGQIFMGSMSLSLRPANNFLTAPRNRDEVRVRLAGIWGEAEQGPRF